MVIQLAGLIDGWIDPSVGVGTLIFSYLRRLWSFFSFGGGVKVLNFNILGVFRKMNIFWGMKILWIFIWGSSQNWTIFIGHFYAFYGLFLRSMYTMGDIFWVAKISNIF